MVSVAEILKSKGLEIKPVALYAHFGRAGLSLEKLYDRPRVSPLKGRKMPRAHNAGMDAIGKWAKTHLGELSPQWKGGPTRPECKMAKRMRRMLHRMMDGQGTKKTAQTFRMIGYMPADLKCHLESLWQEGMSWNNYGKGPGKWNIDHVRPLNTFPSDVEPRIVNALSNLRPLWEHENLKRPKDGSDLK